jgi:Icc-related predicted phosphoesterase
MKIDCVSDLHGHYPQLEGGDLLIIAGDLTAGDTYVEFVEFALWLHNQKYKRYIFIAGNHDNLLAKDSVVTSNLMNTSYLCDSGTEFEGLKVWGSPWTLAFEGMNPKCKAFTVDTEEELAQKWRLIPDDIDILVTHSPEYGLHDYVQDPWDGKIKRCGSKSLTDWVYRHARTLKLHVYGHVHEGYGFSDTRQIHKKLGFDSSPIYVNASHVNERYRPVNKPIRIEL